MLIDPVLHIILHGALALLLLWAALHKLRDVAAFRTALAAYELLPARAVKVVAVMLITAEIGIGGSLLMRGAVAPFAATGLLCVYTAAIAVNLWRGRRHIDCGCVGAAARRPLSSALVMRNAVLIALALMSALPVAMRSLAWIDGVTIGAGIAMLVLLYVAADGLIASGPRIAALAAERMPSSLLEPGHPRVDHA